MPTRLAHSASVSSLTGLPKYFSEAEPTPSQPAPRGMIFKYISRVSSLLLFWVKRMARNISVTFRFTVVSL